MQMQKLRQTHSHWMNRQIFYSDKKWAWQSKAVNRLRKKSALEGKDPFIPHFLILICCLNCRLLKKANRLLKNLQGTETTRDQRYAKNKK